MICTIFGIIVMYNMLLIVHYGLHGMWYLPVTSLVPHFNYSYLNIVTNSTILLCAHNTQDIVTRLI